MRPEQVREIVREEIEKRLQKDPIPGPSFEGGTGEKWEPKKGDLVEVVDSRGFDPKSEIESGDVVKCVGKRKGRLFFLDGDGPHLAKASIYQIKPISIGEAAEPEDNRPDPGVLIPFKEYEKWMTTYSGLCDSLSRYFDDDEPKHVRLFQKATDSMILSASREPEPTSTEPTRPEIIPAEPLRVAPKDYDDGFYLARKRGGVAFFYGGSTYAESTLSSIPNWLERGLLFPATPEGEAGAELRAKQGIVPYPEKSDPAKIETLISEIERMIFEVQTETEFRSEFDFMNEKLEEIRNEVAAMFQEPTPK